MTYGKPAVTQVATALPTICGTAKGGTSLEFATPHQSHATIAAYEADE